MTLKKKIPPLVLVFICVMLGWSLAKIFPLFDLGLGKARPYFALPFILAGVFIIFYSAFQFLKNKTTVNPHSPEKSAVLVTNGLYQFSRNPMYLSMAFVLSGAMLYLSSAIALLSIPLFIFSINRLQILPEEEMLEKIFEEDYRLYLSRVRRWL